MVQNWVENAQFCSVLESSLGQKFRQLRILTMYLESMSSYLSFITQVTSKKAVLRAELTCVLADTAHSEVLLNKVNVE